MGAAALLVSAGATVGCQGGAFGGLSNACPAMRGSADPLQMNFSANAKANAKIKTFVSAAKDLRDVSLQMEAHATEACMRMGADLGLSPQEMSPRQGQDKEGARAQAACGALSARMDAILRQGIQVRVSVAPPQCQANLQAKAQCEGTCSAQIDPGQIVAQCEPARLSGYCQGTCTGRCDGNCNGQCNGQCTQVNAQGQCVGQCNGTCSGSCDATCHASCQGQWQAPQCEGMVQPPSADAECNASCSAKANFRASCSPAQVNVQVYPQNPMALALATTLQANLPQLIHAEFTLGKRLLNDVQVVVRVGAQLPKVIGNAGLEALACVSAAASASVQASARINVSVKASASVSGKVGASG